LTLFLFSSLSWPIDRFFLSFLSLYFYRALLSSQLFGGTHLSPVERPFEEELWLLVLGYRHWVMVAMIYLLSTQACGTASCEQHLGPVSRLLVACDQSGSPPHLLVPRHPRREGRSSKPGFSV